MGCDCHLSRMRIRPMMMGVGLDRVFGRTRSDSQADLLPCFYQCWREATLATPEPVPNPLQIARGVLGALPCQAFIVTAAAERLPIEIFDADHGCLLCAPSQGVQTPGQQVTLVVGDSRRAGYEIDCVVDAFQDDSSLRLAVVDVRRVKPRRLYPRAGVTESGLVRPHGRGTEFDVQVVDVGPGGVAFVSDRLLVVGDCVSGMLNIARRAFPIRARVVHVRPLGFGRMRVGCQFTDITDANRQLLEQIAMQAPRDRRGLRPIELVENTATPEDDSPAVSLGDLRYHFEEVRIPTLRYCRPCGRITLHRDTAPPDSPSEWTCSTCN